MGPDRPFEIIAVDGKNAHLVPAAFHSVYGDDFPVKDVYQPETLGKDIRAGRLIAGLALDTEGRGAGYVSMFKPAPNPRLWEVGNLLVIPEYSHTDLSSRLARYCMDLGTHGTGDIDGIVGEAVCCHYFTQIVAAKNGLVDCGLELDQLDGASFKGKSNRAGTARVSCVLTFWEATELSQKEYVPVRYDAIVRRIAAPLRPRGFSASVTTLPAEGTTTFEERYFPSARTLKVAVPVVGGDWAAIVDHIQNGARERQAISVQVVANMACPHIGEAVEALRERGFFFGGIAPRWFGTDGFLMQRVSGSETDYEETKLYTPIAKDLLSFIRRDRESVKGDEGGGIERNRRMMGRSHD